MAAQGPDGGRLDLSFLGPRAKEVLRKEARERAAMRRKQELWAKRGAAALAAASDMPGGPAYAQAPADSPTHAPANSHPQRERPRTLVPSSRDVTGDVAAGEASVMLGGPAPAPADSPPQRKRPRTEAPSSMDVAAAEPFDLLGAHAPGDSPPSRGLSGMRDATAADEAGPSAAPGPGLANGALGAAVSAAEEAGGQLAAAGQPAVEGAPGAERAAQTGRKRRVSGAAEANLDSRRRQSKPWRPAGDGRSGASAEAAPTTERETARSKESKAAGLRPEVSLTGAESEQQGPTAAAAVTGDGRSASGLRWTDNVEGPSAHGDDDLEGLEYDMLGEPVIPDLGSGGGTVASPGDTGGFESDVSDDGDFPAAASTGIPPEQRASVLPNWPAQQSRDRDTPASSAAAQLLADQGGRLVAGADTGAGIKQGTARGKQMNGSKRTPGHKKGDEGKREALSRGPSKAAGPKAPGKRERSKLASKGPSAASVLPAAVEAQKAQPLVGAVDIELAAHQREKAIAATERRKAVSSATAASAAKTAEPAAKPPQETMLPPKKRARAGMLTAAANSARTSKDVPSRGQPAAVAAPACGKSSTRRPEHKAGERPPQLNGSAAAGVDREEAPLQKGAPRDWAALGAIAAQDAANIDALLAEEEDDL